MAEISPQQQNEAVAQATVDARPATNPIAGSSAEHANRIREKSAKEGARETLSGMLNEKPSEASFRALIDNNIGDEVDPTTGDKVRSPGSQEAQRFTDAGKSLDLIYDYLDNGIMGMNSTKARVARNQMEDIMSQIPELNRVLDGLSDPEIKKVLERHFANPKFREAVVARLDKLKDHKVEGEGTSQAKSEQKQAEREAVAKKREFDRVEAELKSTEAELQRYESNPINPGTNDKHSEIQRLNGLLPGLEADARRATAEINGYDRQIASLQRRLDQQTMFASQNTNAQAQIAVLEQQITDFETKRETAQQKVSDYETQKGKRNQMIQEKTELRERRNELQPEKDKLETEHDGLKAKADSLKGQIARAVSERRQGEREFVAELDDVISDAASDYIRDIITEAEAQNQTVVEEQIASAKDALERQVLQEFGGNRWDKEKVVSNLWRTKRRTTVEIDRIKVNQDYANLVTKGPEELVKIILQDQGLSANEINDKMGDKEFVEKAQEMATKQLLMRRMKVGTITEAEAYKMGTSDWGKEALEKAIQGNADARALVEQLRNEGVLKGKNFSEWLSENPGRKGLIALILTLLTGAGALTGGLAWGASGAVLSGMGTAAGSGALGEGFRRLNRVGT